MLTSPLAPSSFRGRPVPAILLPFLLLVLLPGSASAEPRQAPPPPETGRGSTEVAGSVVDVANPYLSFLPAGAVPDMRRWQIFMDRRARQRRLEVGTRSALGATESEPNDSATTADPIVGFGTGAGESAAVDIAGSFSPASAPALLGPFPEDEGSIPLAAPTGLVAGGSVTISGTIGDGPHGSGGSGTGDHDFFHIPGVELGQVILVDVDTALPMDDLDTFITLYDGAGNIVKLNEDEDPELTLDSYLAVPAPVAGDYYVSIAGSLFPFAALLADPFDETSGFGVGSEGDYEVTIRLEAGDPDWFSVELEACDILGLSLVGAGDHLLIEDPEGTLVVASSQDLSGAYPPSSPLPGGGRVAAAHVARDAGTYRLRALGTGGAYTLELRVFRQPGESAPDPKVLFVDFDGATLDTSIFIGAPEGTAELSPLSDYLDHWGLVPGDEDAVIDAVLASLRENLALDPFAEGPNPSFGVELRNSRDHADPFGQPGVSRLVIGGSINELGIPTIGIAQSIDVGNFEPDETAVVLLDLLSGSSISPDSLNSFPLAPGASMIDFIGVSLGNIAAHEAGHYTGNFHTEQLNAPANLMDRGGNLPNTLGVGEDGTFGNRDDVDVDFGVDNYVDSEGFAGFEDTLTVVACGCSLDAILFADGFEGGNVSAWSASAP